MQFWICCFDFSFGLYEAFLQSISLKKVNTVIIDKYFGIYLLMQFVVMFMMIKLKTECLHCCC